MLSDKGSARRAVFGDRGVAVARGVSAVFCEGAGFGVACIDE